MIIPPKRFPLLQYDQHTESEQAIAEIDIDTILNFMNKVHKHLYSGSWGQMHGFRKRIPTMGQLNLTILQR